MARFYGIAVWLLSSLGAALLLISILLVPQNAAFGQSFGNRCYGYVQPHRLHHLLPAQQ